MISDRKVFACAIVRFPWGEANAASKVAGGLEPQLDDAVDGKLVVPARLPLHELARGDDVLAVATDAGHLLDHGAVHLPLAPEVLLAHVAAPAQRRDALEQCASGRLVRDLDDLALGRGDDVQAADEMVLVGNQRVLQRAGIEGRVGLLRGVEPQLREAIEVPWAARVVDATLEAIDDRVLPVLAQVGNLGHQRAVLVAPVGREVLGRPGVVLADQAHPHGGFGFQCHGSVL